MTETSDLMILEIAFVCTGEQKGLTFYQGINAVNNFEPEFSASSYEILIPTPFPRGIDVTMFLLVSEIKNYRSRKLRWTFQDSKITVIDRDLQYFQPKFTISGTDLFTVESFQANPSEKIYTVKIITTKPIAELNDDIQFTLTATVSFKITI